MNEIDYGGFFDGGTAAAVQAPDTFGGFFDESRPDPGTAYRQVGGDWAKRVERRVLTASGDSWRGPAVSRERIGDAIDADIPLQRAKEEFERDFPGVPYDEPAIRRAAAEQAQGRLLGQRLQRFRESSTSERATSYITTRLPGVGAMAATGGAVKLLEAVERFKADTATLDDYDAVARALAEDERNAQRGLARKFVDILADAPAFLVEWAASGGAGATGRAAATAGAKKLIGEIAEKRLTKAAIGAVGEGVARAATAGVPHIAGDFARRVTPAVGVDDGGRVAVGPDVASPGAELAKSVGGKVIADTAFSAIGGPPGAHVAQPIIKALPKALLASEGAKEAQWATGISEHGGVLSRLAKKDPNAIPEFLIEAGAFATIEAATRIAPRLAARSEQLRRRGLSDQAVGRELTRDVEQARQDERSTSEITPQNESPADGLESPRTRPVGEPAQGTAGTEIVRPERAGALSGGSEVVDAGSSERPTTGAERTDPSGPFGERPVAPDSPLWKWADQLEQTAIAELRALGHGDKLWSVSPETFEPLVKYAAARIIKGGYSATMFARDAVKQFGEAVRPHVEALWNRAQAALRERGTDLRRRVEAGEPVALSEVFEQAGLTATQREVAVARTETSMSDLARQRGTSKQAVNNVETGALERLEQIGLPVASLEQSVVQPGRDEALIAARDRGEQEFTRIDAATGRAVTERVRRADLISMKELSGDFDPETGERLPAVKLRERITQAEALRDELTAVTNQWLKETSRAERTGQRLAAERDAHFQGELKRLGEAIYRAEHPDRAAEGGTGRPAPGREPRAERAEPRPERAERTERPKPAARPVTPPKPVDPLPALRAEFRAVTDQWHQESRQAGRQGLRLPAERDAHFRAEADRLRAAIDQAKRDADRRALAETMRDVLPQEDAPLKPPAIRMAEKWEAEAGDALRELGSGEKLMAGFDPAVLEALGKLVGAKILRGGYTAGQLAKDLGERFGAEAVQHADAIWQRAQVIAQGASTAIANSIAADERSRRGLQPATQEAARSFGQVWGDALRTAERGPEAQDVLIAELAQKPRAVTDREDALLLHRQLELQQRYDQVVAQLEQARASGEPATVVELEHSEALLRSRLQTVYDLNAKVGTETGRGLNARKMLAREDYTLGKLVVQKQAALGRDLNPAEQREVADAHKKISELQAKLDARDALDARRRVETAMGANDVNVAELTREILERDAASKADRVELHDEAYSRLKEFGVTPSSLHGVRRQGRDAASVRGIDEAAADLARRYPGLFPEGENPSDTLFRLLSEGKPKAMTRAEAMAQAREQLAEVAAVFGDDQGDAFEPLVGGQAPRPRQFRAASARQEVDAAWATLKGLTAGKMFSTPIDPQLLIATAKLARAYVRLGVAKVQDFVSAIRERSGKPLTAEAEETLRRGWEAAQGEMAQERTQAALKRLEGVDPSDTARISRVARGLARDAVAGIKDRAGVVAFVKQHLEGVLPGITDRQVMDAISGYGQYKELSKDDVSTKLRDVQAQLRQVAKLEDLRAGQQPLPTGAERRTPSAEEQQLAAQVRDLQRQAGVGDADPAKQRASALASAKTRMRQQIDGLADQIATGEKKLKQAGRVAPDRALEALTVIRDALKKDFENTFGKSGFSDEQRLRLATAATHRSIAELDRRIRERDFARRGNGIVATSPELEAMKARRDALREEFQTLRDADPATQRSAEAKALQAIKTRLANQTADLQERLARGDFAPTEKKPATQRDAEADRLQFQLDQAKAEFRRTLREDELARRTTAAKVFDTAGKVVNTARAIVTSFDLSAVGRQGGLASAGHPLLAKDALAESVKAFGSEEAAHRVRREIAGRAHSTSGLYKRSGLALSEPGGKASAQEEAYVNSWADRLPGVAGSERAYTTFLDRIRADVFDAMTAALGKGGKAVSEAEAKQIAHYVNTATGKGNLGEYLNNASWLSTLFFAPRYVKSRFDYLTFQPLRKGLLSGEGSWRARKLIAQEYARSAAGLGLFYGTAALALTALVGDDGWSIELTPTSSDFLKIKVGNTRIDPAAGLQQVAVLLARLGTGEKKQLSGRTVPIRGQVPYGGDNAFDVLTTFGRSKLAPVPGAVVDVLTGKTVVGEPVTPGSVAANLTVPLGAREIYEAMKEQGVPGGTALGLLSFFGAGVQTFDPKKKPGREPVGR